MQWLGPWRRVGWRASERWMRRRRLGLRILGAGLGLGLLIFLILLVTLPDPRALETGWPERTAYMEGWLEGAEGRSIDHRPVPLARIPQSVVRAVLVSEDAGFYGHSGFDWFEIRAALERAWEEKRVPRGASTITQQLARNLYLSPSRNPLRKAREALIARRLEKTLSKRRILELYLNVIEFGPGVYGVEAASRRYFGKSVGAVTPREAAELAGTIPSPRGNNPATRTRAFQTRADRAFARAFGAERIPAESLLVEPPRIESPAAESLGVEPLELEPAAIDTLGFEPPELRPPPVDSARTADSVEVAGARAASDSTAVDTATARDSIARDTLPHNAPPLGALPRGTLPRGTNPTPAGL